MFDLIKTFILGIWIEKKYRYIFIFIFITIVYRFMMWFSILMMYEISPVNFVKLNNNGSLTFVYANRYKQTIYPYAYQLPTKHGHKNKVFDVKNVKNTKQCEKDFFLLYKQALEKLLQSSEDGKFILKFQRKFPYNLGEITYYNREGIENNVFQTLYKQGFVFDRKDNIDFCQELKDKTIVS